VAITDRTTPVPKSPAFQFYPGDYLSSSRVQRMSMTERGVYVTLLSFQWLDGSLPNDMRRLSQMVGMKQAQFDRMWKNGPLNECFVPTEDGRLVNTRLESERQKQLAFRERQQANGKRGGRRVSDPPNPDESQKNPDPSQTLARALKTEEEDRDRSLDLRKEKVVAEFDGQAAFLQLLKAYPKNRISSGQRTQEMFVQAVFAGGTPAQTFALMLANLENHNRSHEWRVKGMAPNLYRWLEEGLWQREMDEEAPLAERVTSKTNRTMSAAAEVLAAKRPA
jgi:uncharacterized protein YdaU (DUF1376 family)